MRFFADENFPGPVIRGLRALGHDVLSASETLRGSPDRDVLGTAQSEARVLLTCDKDFGELAFRSGLPAQCGVILLRLSGSSPARDNERAVRAIAARTDWPGHFAVVTDARVRLRPLAARRAATEGE